jgi:hypothetical protein
MKKNAQWRDPKRFSKILSKILQSWPAQLDHQPISTEVVSLEANPKPVPNRAVLPRPRRAKGVPKAPRKSQRFEQLINVSTPTSV